MINRRRILAGGAALALSACATAGPTPEANRELTVATFNIWHNLGDWPARQAGVIEALRAVDADVIALQEVLEDAPGLPNQAATIAEALSGEGGAYSVHFVSTDPLGQPRRYGNAILTRLPVIATDETRLRPLDDHRTAAHVRVEFTGRPIDIHATHLHWQEEGGAIRAQQLADLIAFIDKRSDAPVIVMGDMNAEVSGPEFAPLLARYGDAWRIANPGAPEPNTLNPENHPAHRRIDHILVETEHFAPLETRLFATQPNAAGVHPSDHFGVVSRLRVK